MTGVADEQRTRPLLITLLTTANGSRQHEMHSAVLQEASQAHRYQKLCLAMLVNLRWRLADQVCPSKIYKLLLNIMDLFIYLN